LKLYFKQLELGPLQNFVYLIGSLETREAMVVDPGWDVPKILETAAQDEMKITRVLATHTHFDHINGIPEVVKATDARVLVHKKEAEVLPIEKSNIVEVEGGHEFEMGPFKLSLLHTPGHTPGSVCLQVADRLMTGDTLFLGGCGRCDLPGGDPELLYKSLTRLRQLDDRLVLYTGHNYAPELSSTLGKEKTRNPFLSAPDLDSFLKMVGGVKRRG